MIRVSHCYLFSISTPIEVLEEKFYEDHGTSFNEFINRNILNNSPYVINWGLLNATWDFTILDLHKFTVKVLITKSNDHLLVNNYPANYHF